MKRPRTVVLGIGNPMRRDDGVGHKIVAHCSHELERAKTRTVAGTCELRMLDGEATRVIDAWRDRDLAIVVDAIVLGATPGTIYEFEFTDDLAERHQLGQLAPQAPVASSHYAGIGEAIALGQALDRMPRSLVLIGIEPGDVGFGIELTPEVAASLEAAAARVERRVRGT